MTRPAPRLDPRRKSDFERELLERARAWIPSWASDEAGDFGHALLRIAARFGSEVAERFDGSGEKMRLGLLDWLGMRGEAARPARMPVVFKMPAKAPAAVLGRSPLRMQVEAANASVVFESESDIRLVPGRLDLVVATDAGSDELFLPPPALTEIEPAPPAPEQWQLESFAPPGADKLQLDPEAGLEPGTIVAIEGAQFRMTEVDKDLVTIEPPVPPGGGFDAGTPVRKVLTFEPFEPEARNWQEHALYLGDTNLFDIEAAATIEIVGAKALGNAVEWQYWGKLERNGEEGWQPFTLADQAAQDASSGAVVLTKPRGAVEPHEIAPEKKSRWIRAKHESLGTQGTPLQVDSFAVRINCADFVEGPSTSAESALQADGMANTTPLVLESVFFPLGKEPRQFDAFYLGCAEAFSKPRAEAQLWFEMADTTFGALAAVRDGPFADQVLAGVAQDGALHLLQIDPVSGVINKFRDREPLRPPRPEFGEERVTAPSVSLNGRPPWQPAVWSLGSGFIVAVSAGTAVWTWLETSDREDSGWQSQGELPAGDPSAPIDGLVYFGDGSPELLALQGGKLFRRPLWQDAQWERVDTKHGSTPIALKSIVPVLVDSGTGALVTSAAAGMVGISEANKLFRVSSAGACTPLLASIDFDPDVRPVAIELAPGDRIVAAVDRQNPPHLRASRGSLDAQAPLGAGIVGSLEVLLSGTTPHVLCALANDRLVSWAPFDADALVFESAIASDIGRPNGSPLALGRRLVVPGSRADLLVADFDVTRRTVEQANVGIGIVIPDSLPVLAPNDSIVREIGGALEARQVAQAGSAKDGEVFYPLDSDFSSTSNSPLLAFRSSEAKVGTLTPPDELELADTETAVGDWLMIGPDFFKVDSIDDSVDPRIAKLLPVAPGGPAPTSGSYVRPLPTGGRLVPFMRLGGSSGNWDASLLQRTPLVFPAESPQKQRAKAFEVSAGGRPILVVLAEEFAPRVTNPVRFVVDEAVDTWERRLGDATSNPELSWEYWNGRGWWRLDVTVDQTLNLKISGAVRFSVPEDIEPTDWSGKTNHWIRARLIGGDYGREKVITRTSPTGTTGETEQTSERSTEGIRPPSVLGVHIAYRLCQNMTPSSVWTSDTGSLRDQSEANRAAGAIVEAFVPVSFSLGRLLAGGSALSGLDEGGAACECGGASAEASSEATDSGVGASRAVIPATGRSVFLGFDARLAGDSVKVLLMIEREMAARGIDADAFAPLVVEALVGDRFVPLVVEDGTRALGESGLLTLSFPDPPTRVELFGSSLLWLRLTPAATARAGTWSPSLRGAYLNAVWARASETLTRELLGSSEGQPHLELAVARPPVLRHSLELRVKEPLGEEERAALLAEHPDNVLSEVENLPGDWVRWEQVVDTDDEGPGRRVYSLEEESGEIRFGDGLHGAIPPIGRDSIVAFRYQRTEPPAEGAIDVPANQVAARTKLNLVSPVESVEAVFSADDAAGGAPYDSVARVARFATATLRHRGRAVTLRDLEDLTLQSSPAIVQARALTRARRIRLVAVMRGAEPTPNAAQRRELERHLLSAAPPSFDADKLEIRGPRLRRLRIELSLQVERLDDAGRVAEDVKTRLQSLFDTATGGVSKRGWPLGVGPRAEDVVYALGDVPELLGIADIELREVQGRGTRPWAGTLAPHELAWLDGDPVRIRFASREAAA